jgi:aldehyde dehydrogenase (NAD+)
MIDAKKFYINGEWITPTNSETIDVINPANEKVFTSIGSGCVNDINKAVDAAKEAFKIYSKTEIDERIILLKKFIIYIKKNMKKLLKQYVWRWVVQFNYLEMLKLKLD